jgi:hypothetical protein
MVRQELLEAAEDSTIGDQIEVEFDTLTNKESNPFESWLQLIQLPFHVFDATTKSTLGASCASELSLRFYDGVVGDVRQPRLLSLRLVIER